MKKDIFIDTQLGILFANTKDEHLLALIKWLLEYDEKNQDKNAHLVMSNDLRIEYLRSNKDSEKEFSISAIYYTLQRQGRLNGKSPNEIKKFQRDFFTQKVWKDLQSKRPGSDDPSHIALIFLSDRRLAISVDVKFVNDVENFPKRGIKGVKVCIKGCPSKLKYKDYLNEKEQEKGDESNQSDV